ncbi:TPA: sugar kinase [Vibrio parahaemolyticus]|uniref:sugar kinase n=2 Tax=Vibrio parahaemolyticus TaxID=670 RepID=UPI00038E1D7A|nr:sugar kinase [Vibrio parahaemolyticus]APC89674.1 2-dehydro-3-deoxygluconate kinase [Vibrio parahaemolyticus]EGR1119275.1 sugar kinase [Vibrio parahaemolyticus]ELA8153089.1 sugar kinase [Vibrio parahaemolyticus]ELB2118315.1 sugar kinase [Vibrio parahaemolyticus]EQM15955.1 pfkB carbohydrate kinase family protein [Vibrio parahaemolyticus 3259]
MKKIALIGECMIELSGQPFGQMTQSYGGDTLNTAVYLSRLNPDLKPAYITALGEDSISQYMAEKWQVEGIDTQYVLIDPAHPTGLYMIQLDDAGERSFAYWRHQSAASQLLKHEQFSKIEQALMSFDFLYLSGISLAILDDEDRAKLISILTDARHRGARVIFDSNYRPSLWSSRLDAQHWYQAIVNISDYLLLTSDDEQALWGDKSLETTIQRLNQQSKAVVVIKQGADGCSVGSLANWNNSVTHHPANPVEKVIDTTSAGDSFNAGFIWGIGEGLELGTSCQIGNLLASKVIQYKGAIVPSPITDLLRDKLYE